MPHQPTAVHQRLWNLLVVHLVLEKLQEQALRLGPLRAGAWGSFRGGELQGVVRHSWEQWVGQVRGLGQAEEGRGHTWLGPGRRREVLVPQEPLLEELGLQRSLPPGAEAEPGGVQQRELGGGQQGVLDGGPRADDEQ